MSSKFQFLPLSGKTKSATHPFYCILRKLPKCFILSGSIAKRYSVELLKLCRKSRILNYKEFYRITFLQTFPFELAHLMLHVCKISGFVTKQNIEIETNVSYTFFFPDSRNFTLHFHSGILRAQLSVEIWIHPLDAFIQAMS